MNTRPSIIPDNMKQLTVLTGRQQQVATLACQGLSNREIATRLGVAEGTVKIYLHAIYKKLDVRSRFDLIMRFGRSQQIIRLNI
jgi:two-component system, NarL family, nitrate/nitrite response regulator NarL